MAGHGLSQTLFSPLQTLVVNPDNISPVSVREVIIIIIIIDINQWYYGKILYRFFF